LGTAIQIVEGPHGGAGGSGYALGGRISDWLTDPNFDPHGTGQSGGGNVPIM
jgi:hypothetical protein